MFEILVSVLMTLVFGFMWATVIVGMNWMVKVSKMSEEEHREMFNLHIRA